MSVIFKQLKLLCFYGVFSVVGDIELNLLASNRATFGQGCGEYM